MKICETVEDCKNKRSISDQHKMKTILPGVTSSIPNVNLEAIKFSDIAFWERKKKKRKKKRKKEKKIVREVKSKYLDLRLVGLNVR